MSIDSLINLSMLIVTIFLGGGSLWFTWKQWEKIKKKIAMINDAGKALEIVPAWYTLRMMGKDLGGGIIARDYWPFGLLMSDGRIIVVTGIVSLSDDGKWMDVELASEDFWSPPSSDKSNYLFAICDRKKASVQVSHIILGVELASS